MHVGIRWNARFTIDTTYFILSNDNLVLLEDSICIVDKSFRLQVGSNWFSSYKTTKFIY